MIFLWVSSGWLVFETIVGAGGNGVLDSANEKVYEMNIGVCVLGNFSFHFIIIVESNVQYYTILSINVRVWIVTLRSNKIIGKNFF